MLDKSFDLFHFKALLSSRFARMGLLADVSNASLPSNIAQFSHEFSGRKVQLGGFPFEGFEYLAPNQGRQLLGQEVQLLVWDLSEGWDANSICSAMGAISGGGCLVVCHQNTLSNNPGDVWLYRQLMVLPKLSHQFDVTQLTSMSIPSSDERYSEQDAAVEQIVKVARGRRKRPLVLTADRGRGKSSSLGLACAELMDSKATSIIITAPTPAAVEPTFRHCSQLLEIPWDGKTNQLNYKHSQLQFVAPDALIRGEFDVDLVLIDEASAIPIPLLTQLVERFSRTVISTTIHGYEGCGRGFTLKFLSWLSYFRPGYTQFHMSTPMRWRKGDLLEAWQYETFLLAPTESSVSTGAEQDIRFEAVNARMLIDQPMLLKSLFSLLVDAHYQTSPNDLFLLLNNDAQRVIIAFAGDEPIGCIWSVIEGALDDALISDISLGKRRPKGHFIPVTLINQLGWKDGGALLGERILRIAVRQDQQRQGLGSKLINECIQATSADYVATSFGATDELVTFWARNQFIPVKLGSQRDAASGTHSIVMVCSDNLPSFLSSHFTTAFCHSLSCEYAELSSSVVQTILSICNETALPIGFPLGLLEQYAQGGSNHESVSVWLRLLAVSHPRLLSSMSALFIEKILQDKSWGDVARQHGLPGRKSVEALLRDETGALLTGLQCKLNDKEDVS
jgi:tRNA(Met) cytidine acetyltransferase